VSRLWVCALLGATALLAASLCVVVIDQREVAFRTLLDQAEVEVAGLALNRAVLDEPGWYVRIPLVHQLYRFDGRSLRYESSSQLAYTAESLPVRVDYYALWRIADPRLFYESLRTDLELARARIDNTTYGKLRNALSRYEFSSLLSDQRDAIIADIRAQSDAELARQGIRILDLRIRALDFPEGNLEQIYRRMRSERERFGLRARAQGTERAAAVRSQADQESQVIVAQAEREAARERGEGDAEAARIYGETYGRDPEFYAFTRSLEAYRKALDEQTTLVLSPDVPFLKYLFGGAGVPPAEAAR
jgi:membrane protease subunit HflC